MKLAELVTIVFHTNFCRHNWVDCSVNFSLHTC